MIKLGSATIEAVLFDLDGTLVHTHIDFALMRAEMRRMALQAGAPASTIEGKQVLEVVNASCDAVGPRGVKLRSAMWAKLEQIEREGCSNASLVPGAQRILKWLTERGVATAIVTRNCRAVSMELLDRFGLTPDALLAREDVPRAKPDPSHLDAAMRLLGSQADNTCMVGDHWLDIRAGVAIGAAATVGVIGDRDASCMDACPPNYIVRDLDEAVALFS